MSSSRRGAAPLSKDAGRRSRGSRPVNPARLTRSRTACRICWKLAAAAGLRAMSTISQPSLTAVSRAASRIRRRTRLRVTAFPTRLLTEKPKRTRFNSLGNARRTSSGWTHALPCAKSRAKSASRTSRFSLLKTRGSLDDGQSSPSTQTPQAQNLPAAPRAHARPKAMLSAARDPFGLIRSLRHPIPSKKQSVGDYSRSSRGVSNKERTCSRLNRSTKIPGAHNGPRSQPHRKAYDPPDEFVSRLGDHKSARLPSIPVPYLPS